MMTLELGEESERIIRRKVESGDYQSADEVVGAALRLLDEWDETGLEELRRELARGIEDADQGRLTDGPEVFAALRRKLDQSESLQ